MIGRAAVFTILSNTGVLAFDLSVGNDLFTFGGTELSLSLNAALTFSGLCERRREKHETR